MSVSEIIANLRAKEQANVERALAQQQFINDVLGSIREDTPGQFRVERGGYCADGYIVFTPESAEDTNLARRLYELYPPFECVDLKGNSQSQKPVKYVRDQDRYDSQRPIFPVLVKTTDAGPSARWWTSMGGRDIEIQVRGGSLAEFADLLHGKYLPDTHSFATGSVTFWRRALKKQAVRPGAMVSWLHAWPSFAKAKGMSDEAESFLWALSKRMVDRSQEPAFVTAEGLAQVKMPFSGEESPFTRIFSVEEQAMVVAFASEQYQKLGAALKQQAEDFETVHKWFVDFFGRFGHYFDSDPDLAHRIYHRLRKDTGLDVTVRMMRPHPHVGVFLNLYFKGWDQFPDYMAPFSKDPNAPRVKAQDIEVEYVE